MAMNKPSESEFKPTMGNKASVSRYEIQHTGISSGGILETKPAAIDQIIKKDSNKAEMMVQPGLLNEESSSGTPSYS